MSEADPFSFSEFDREIDRRGTGSLKWEKYTGRDILPLWVADMDFSAPQEVLEALHRRVNHGVLGYSVAHDGVKEAVREYFQRDHGMAIDTNWLVWLPGMVPALAQAASIAGRPGDSLMVSTPVYPPFLKVHADTGRHLIRVPLRESGGAALEYSIDFDAMEAAVTPGTRLLILCNPHNPVGRVFPAEDLQRLADFCVRHDLLLCSDEIHCDLLLEPQTQPHTTALKLSGDIQERLIVLMAASKTYNIPGLGCAFAVIPDPALRKKFAAARNTFVAEVNPLGYHATEAAYRHGGPWLQRLRAYLKRNRDTLTTSIRTRLPEIRIPDIAATYLAWLDVRSLGIDAPAAYFESHGLGLSNGADFGLPGCVRLNFGCRHSLLQEALQRLEKAVRQAKSATS
jgi:cystathionine beta-lyase